MCGFVCGVGEKSVPEPGRCFCQCQAGYQLLAGIHKLAERWTTSSIAGHVFKLFSTRCEISLFFTAAGKGCTGVYRVFGRGMPPEERQTVLLKLLI